MYGRGLASDLASTGAKLVIASRNLAGCQRVAEEEKQLGHDVVAESFDQGEEPSIQKLCDRIMERYGRVDGLVNNSVLRAMSSLDGPTAEWELSLRVNATGVMLMHRYFGELMCRQGGGSIVNIGSIQGMVGPTLPMYEGLDMAVPTPDYFFHKAGMLSLTRYYAALFGPKDVRVNCLSPGGLFNEEKHTEPYFTRYNNQTFLRRMGDPQDLGGAVIFLLSQASRYITGANLAVDGGYTAH